MVSWMLLVFLLKYKLHPEPSSFNFFFSYGMAVKYFDKTAVHVFPDKINRNGLLLSLVLCLLVKSKGIQRINLDRVVNS